MNQKNAKKNGSRNGPLIIMSKSFLIDPKVVPNFVELILDIGFVKVYQVLQDEFYEKPNLFWKTKIEQQFEEIRKDIEIIIVPELLGPSIEDSNASRSSSSIESSSSTEEDSNENTVKSLNATNESPIISRDPTPSSSNKTRQSSEQKKQAEMQEEMPKREQLMSQVERVAAALIYTIIHKEMREIFDRRQRKKEEKEAKKKEEEEKKKAKEEAKKKAEEEEKKTEEEEEKKTEEEEEKKTEAQDMMEQSSDENLASSSTESGNNDENVKSNKSKRTFMKQLAKSMRKGLNLKVGRAKSVFMDVAASLGIAQKKNKWSNEDDDNDMTNKEAYADQIFYHFWVKSVEYAFRNQFEIERKKFKKMAKKIPQKFKKLKNCISNWENMAILI